MNIDSVGIIGGGAWGTALAQTMRRAGRDVMLWAREADVVGSINERHVNETFLPGVTLDAGDPRHQQAGRGRDLRCAAAGRAGAARALRGKALRPSLRRGQPVVICAKGIEQATGKMMGDIVAAELPEAIHAALSGPSFAADVARGLPTALTIACADETVGPPARRASGQLRSSGSTGRAIWSASSSAAP